jgi:hypothetical protein
MAHEGHPHPGHHVVARVEAGTQRVGDLLAGDVVSANWRTLKPGRYRLTAIAIDAAGNRSNPVRVTITAQ